MRTIKIEVEKLRAVVQENREKHRAIFEEAMTGYRKAAITELDKMIADAKAGKKIRRSLTLVEPVDQTRDYDRVLKALELTSDTIVDLTEQEFAQYVLDDWGWKRQFIHANSTYVMDLMEQDSGDE